LRINQSTEGDETSDPFIVEAREKSPANCLLVHLKEMHLACFILLFIANVVPSGSSNKVILNWRLVKALMSFLTIPYYIYYICYAFYTLDKQIITYTDDSTAEDYSLAQTLYVSKQYGNSILWIKLEIFAFYCNLIVCFLYLAKARCTTTKDDEADHFGYMVVCQDYENKEQHDSATNVKVFDVQGSAGRQKLKEHLKMQNDTDYTINTKGSKLAASEQYKVKLTWGRTLANEFRKARITDDLLNFLISKAQFVGINLTQILISLAALRDAEKSKSDSPFD